MAYSVVKQSCICLFVSRHAQTADIVLPLMQFSNSTKLIIIIQ